MNVHCKSLLWLALLSGSLSLCAQDTDPKVRKGKLEVLRDHDTIELYFSGRRLISSNPLALAALHGQVVELEVRPEDGRNTDSIAPDRRRAKLASVVRAINPQPWSGAGVVRQTNGELTLLTQERQFTVVAPHSGLTSRLADAYLRVEGWAFNDSDTLVLSAADARIVVSTDKEGNASEGAYLNERTVNADGEATYGERVDLEPGTQVRVFDVAAYRRAQDGKPGVWRASLADMVGGDILLARVSMNRREGNAVSGWIPARKLAFGGPIPADQQGLTGKLQGKPTKAKPTAEASPAPQVDDAREAGGPPPQDVPQRKQINLPLGG